MICEPWRAWRVIWDSAALARCAGHGVCSCVGVRVDVCDGYVALPEVRFKRKSQKYDQFSLKSMLVVPSQFDSLKSVLSL